MADLRLAPARPGQAVVVAADLRVVLRRAQRHEVELVLVLHMRLEALRRLPAIAGRPAAAVDLAQDVLGHRLSSVDLDVLEHPLGEAELLREQVHRPRSRPSTRRPARRSSRPIAASGSRPCASRRISSEVQIGRR